MVRTKRTEKTRESNVETDLQKETLEPNIQQEEVKEQFEQILPKRINLKELKLKKN